LREIIIKENESGQRLDRFLRKYLDKAPRSFLYRMIRKKNIELNHKRTKPETTIYKGDSIQLFLADETIEKFRTEIKIVKSDLDLDIVYEDKNIILINKDIGVLSHGDGRSSGSSIVDGMVNYLIEKKDYKPEVERTFTPSICNRLDRNTCGIIIGAKNYQSLKIVNEALRQSHIHRFYKTIVYGIVDEDFQDKAYISRDKNKNITKVSKESKGNRQEIQTKIKVLKTMDKFSLLEIQLLTGRTHQIRSHLSYLGYPIIGDRKYGNKSINDTLDKKYRLKYQYLHGYKVKFQKLEGSLKYLNGESFESKANEKYLNIEEDLFN